HQAIDTDALTCSGWQPHFKGPYIVGVVIHSLKVTGILFCYLSAETCGLGFGIIELGEAIGDLAPTDEKLKTVGDERVGIITTRQRTNFGWVFRDERWLIEPGFGDFLENLGLDLAQAPAFLDLNIQTACQCP